ncbi:MAG: hypothetical protein IPN33_09120 [Saprospiraceae bacterium]|nr:hypothetical protein [Saprospiraceae bacterium]
MFTTLTTFKLKQNPAIGQWRQIILALSGFVLLAFWGNETTWLRNYIIGAWAVAVGLGFVLWRKAKCTLYVDSAQLVIEVSRAGYKMPVGKTSLPWQNLISYKFDYGENENTLVLKWSNGISQTFSGRDLEAFYAYLKTNFFNRER